MRTDESSGSSVRWDHIAAARVSRFTRTPRKPLRSHSGYAELTEADTAEDWSEIPSVYATLPEEGDSSHQQDETPSKAPELAFDSEANIVPTCVCSHCPAV